VTGPVQVVALVVVLHGAAVAGLAQSRAAAKATVEALPDRAAMRLPLADTTDVIFASCLVGAVAWAAGDRSRQSSAAQGRIHEFTGKRLRDGKWLFRLNLTT
jgi:hypothetical protein